MSDSIENQINQYTLEQNSSPQVPTLRNKKNKNKILAAVALIMLLAVGAISSFILLGQEQDTRNQASVAQGLVNIKLQKNTDCAIGKTCYIDVLVNTGSSNIDALQAKVVFDQNSVGSVDGISFKPSESLNYQRQLPTESGAEVSVQGDAYVAKMPRATEIQGEISTKSGQGITFEENSRMENSKMIAKPMLSLVKNEVSPSKEILLAWTLMSTSVPFNSNNGDYLLGRIEFVAKQTFKSGDSTNNMVVSLDPSFSKATLYKTGQDSLNTPSPLTIAINMENTTERIRCKTDDSCPTGQYCYYEPTPSGVRNFMANAYCKEKVTKPGMCQTDADCAKNEYCYQPPMPACPEGAMCKMSLPVKSCKERPVTVTPTKVPSSTPTPIATVTPGKTSCRTDADCTKGQTCYQPPMPTCPEGKVCPQVMPTRYCKESVVVVSKTPTPTPVVSVTIKPSITPISCAVPDCKNGVLRVMKTQSDVSRSGIVSQSCPIYVCEEIATCQYDYSIWSECSYGVQARAITSSDKVGCSAPILKRSCDKPCSSDSNCSAGEVCIKKQAPQTTAQEGARITSMGYCSAKPALSYDLNGDGAVNVLDLSVVIKNLFTNNANADVNKDKTVDIADYSLVLKSLINREFIAY